MNIIPSDIISCIFEYLDTKDLIWASRVSKKWRKVFCRNLWRYKIDLSPYFGKITNLAWVKAPIFFKRAPFSQYKEKITKKRKKNYQKRKEKRGNSCLGK